MMVQSVQIPNADSRQSSTATPVIPDRRPEWATGNRPLIHIRSTKHSEGDKSTVSFFQRLPAEIRHIIIRYMVEFFTQDAEFLDGGSLATLACINSEWQDIVESYTFRDLYMNPETIARFTLDSRRKKLIQKVTARAVLPKYSLGSSHETPAERATNAHIFVKTVTGVLNYLATWYLDEVSPKGITLRLEAFSPSDIDSSRPGRSFIIHPRRAEGELSLPDDLLYLVPNPVKVVSGYKSPPQSSRTITQPCHAMVVSKLACCRSVDLTFPPGINGFQAVNELIVHIDSWPPSLENVSLIRQPEYLDAEQPQYEPFWDTQIAGSNFLQALMSQNLRHMRVLRLFYVITAKLFFLPYWSQTSGIGNLEAFLTDTVLPDAPFTSMERFDFTYQLLIGRFRDVPPAEGEQGELMTTFRHEVMLAAGRMAYHMPRLVYFKTGQRDHIYCGKHNFEYTVLARGDPEADSPKFGEATLRITSTFNFEPDAIVLKVWQAVSKKNAHARLRVQIVKDKN